MRKHPIQRLEPLHFISASVGGLFALLVCSVSAQSPSPTPATAASPSEAEPVIVTGSQIPTQTAAEVGANPVQVIDRHTIDHLHRIRTDLRRSLSWNLRAGHNHGFGFGWACCCGRCWRGTLCGNRADK